MFAMSYDPNQEIYVAEVVAQPVAAAQPVQPPSSPPGFDPPKKSGRSCLLIALIVLGMGLLVLIGGGVAIYRALAPKDVIVETEAEAVERRKSEQAEVRLAFSNAGQFVPTDQREFDAISKLIARVSEAANDEVQNDIHDCIDFDRYSREARRNPELNRLAYFGNAVFSATVTQRVVGPIPFSDYRIFSIEKINEGERKVILQTWGVYEDVAPYVYWVSMNDRNEWKLYDWEPLEFGLRDSKESAVLMGESDASRIRAFETYVAAVVAYVDETGERHSDDVKQALLDCQTLNFHKAISDSSLYNVATHFLSSDDYKSAKIFLNLVKDRAATPGVYRLLGEIALQREEYAVAVENFNSYLDLIGPTPGLLEDLASAYSELEEGVNELETRRRLIGFMEDGNSANLVETLFLEAEGGLSDFFKDIEKLDLPNRFFIGLVNQVGSNAFVIPKYEKLVDYLEARTEKPDSTDGDKALAMKAKSELAFCRGEFEKGMDLLGLPLLMADEDNAYEYWWKAIELEVVAAKFREVKDKGKALESISVIYEEYNDNFSASDLLEIARIAIESKAVDAAVYHIAGSAAYQCEEYEAAIKYLAEAKEQFDESESANRITYNSQLLAYSYFSVGNTKAAIEEIGYDATLLYLAAEEKKLVEFKSVIDSISSAEEKAYFQAQSLMEQEEFGQAKAILLKSIEEARSETRNAMQYQVITSLIECCRQEGNVIDAYLETRQEIAFNRVAQLLLDDRDWANAERLAVAGRRQLAKRTTQTVDLRSVMNLEHKILWQQGKLKELANAITFGKDAEKLAELDDNELPELEYIFRAALRTNNLVLADQVATLSRDSIYPNYTILRLMALQQKDYDRLKRLKLEQGYDSHSIYSDPDCPKLTKKKIVELANGTSRELTSNFGSYYPNEQLSVLLSEPLELNAEKVTAIGKAAFLDPVTVTRMEDQANGKAAWFLQSGKTILAISQSDELSQFKQVKSGPLRKALEDSKQLIRFEFDTLDWHPGEPYQACLRLANEIKFENSVAIGFNGNWQAWDDGRLALGKIRQGDLLYSEFEKSMSGQVSFEQDSVAFDVQAEAEFQVTLADAYQRFSESNSKNKRLIVSARMGFGSISETLELDVDSIDLAAWGGNTIEAKMITGALMDSTLEQGEMVQQRTDFIFRWKLMIDGEESSSKSQ